MNNMKILAFSDLHYDIRRVSHRSQVSEMIKELVKTNKPDIVIFAGDTFDYVFTARKLSTYSYINPNAILREIVGHNDIPIIYCLGNHEFAYSSVSETLDYFFEKNKNQKNIFCLDVSDVVTIQDVSFIGNVLWYDGSQRTQSNKDNSINPRWLDSTIINFDFIQENKRCVERLNNQLRTIPENNKIVLVTHCTPHKELNEFCLNDKSNNDQFNMYGGMTNLFNSLIRQPDAALCGHTHRQIIKKIKHNEKTILGYCISNQDRSLTITPLIIRI